MKQNAIINRYTLQTITLKTQILAITTFFHKKTSSKYQQEKEQCESPLTTAECLQSLKKMAFNKSPGTDGLPAEFYKVFWSYIHPYLLKSLNTPYKKGLLAISQRRGLISPIPKKNRALYYIKNWRPITLLNCDYKIATKAIATRIRNVLPNIISSDRTGFQYSAYSPTQKNSFFFKLVFQCLFNVLRQPIPHHAEP